MRKNHSKLPVYYENRYDSFISGNWPFLSNKEYLAQPEFLASAGFYFVPQPDHPDNVKCAYCNKELDEWCSDDDPFVIHCRHSDTCIWAKVHCKRRTCGKTDADGNFSQWPTDTVSACQELLAFIEDIPTRYKTFGKHWPFSNQPKCSVTPTKMAEAGFYYAPDRFGDDTVLCGFCNCTLNYWEPNDDPM
ncbi:Protein bir1 [Smittium mucronatum]|uniref:Protein bir1 n=1 Tax=Smittium mucronatum TaxID=133383 RepID=A0A1R0GNA4_9FUNG|nr:Protein bir1 [Smittium mucronatum]